MLDSVRWRQQVAFNKLKQKIRRKVTAEMLAGMFQGFLAPYATVRLVNLTTSSSS